MSDGKKNARRRSWRVMNETAPGGPFEELATGMVDYGAFVYDSGDVHGTGSRGF